MLPRCLPGVFVLGLPIVVLLAAPAPAARPLNWIRPHPHAPPPGNVADPLQLTAFPPGPYYPANCRPGCSGRHSYDPGTPSFRWGYFGAPYRPAHACHKGYYGQCIQWHYRRGY